MAFTEYYCDFTNGSNLNAGSTNTAAVYTSAGGDSDGTSVFTPNDGSTPASTVSVGMFGSVYVTAGATIATFTGRITTVAAGVNGAITFSTTAKSGTFPAASAGAHTISIAVGGYWKGPNAAVGFPFNFITAVQTNVAGDPVRVNFVNTATYTITAAITHSLIGSVKFQGMTASAGDGGRATIDGGTSGSGYSLLTVSNNIVAVEDMIFQNNGTATGGAGNGLIFSGLGCIARRVIANNIRNSGFSSSGAGNVYVECETYACCLNNGATSRAFDLNGNGVTALRCYSHDNVGNASSGFYIGQSCSLTDCVADSNGQYGYYLNSGSGQNSALYNCDAYNNTSDGVHLTNASSNPMSCYIENCNLVKNGGFGINNAGTGGRTGYVVNCGFGAGTQVNTSGQTSLPGSIVVSGSVTYATDVTPWRAPTTGDFSIILGTAKFAGRGAFVETDGTNTGTVAYPDIGAAQHVQAPIGLTTGARAMTTY